MESAMKELCAVCQEDTEIAVRIAADGVCEDCVHAGLMPMFVKALHHEADFPPKWGRIILDPKDFKSFFIDGDDFMIEWKKRILEYHTPVNIRLYCGNCQAFVCDKDERRWIRLGCVECKALICSSCGGVDENDGKHECKEVTDAFEGLTLGKDYQICPNPDCQMRVELKDGCNAMSCASSSCNTQFCFVCGEETGHDSNHRRAGSKCPRFNQPGARNAHFDRAQANQQEEEDLFEFIVGRNSRRPADIPEMQRLIAEIDQLDLRDVKMALRLMGRVTAFVATPLPAGFHHQTNFERLAAEAHMAAQIEATPLALLMRHQQGQLVALAQVAEAMIRDHAVANPNVPVPAFLPAAIDLFVKLHTSLDMYIWPARLQAGSSTSLAARPRSSSLRRQHAWALWSTTSLWSFVSSPFTLLLLISGFPWRETSNRSSIGPRAFRRKPVLSSGSRCEEEGPVEEKEATNN